MLNSLGRNHSYGASMSEDDRSKTDGLHSILELSKWSQAIFNGSMGSLIFIIQEGMAIMRTAELLFFYHGTAVEDFPCLPLFTRHSSVHVCMRIVR